MWRRATSATQRARTLVAAAVAHAVRRLLGSTDSVSISFPIMVSVEYAHLHPEGVLSSIDSALASAVSTGALAANLAAAGGDSVIGAASVDSASATVDDDACLVSW